MTVIRRHRVLTFFVLACALTWGGVPWRSFFVPGVLIADAATPPPAHQAHTVGLKQVGPIDETNGFPLWYKDTSGTRLELCLDPNDANCILGDLPHPGQPVSFPDNFPDEAFWSVADSSIDAGGGDQAQLVTAVEAAFASADGLPAIEVVAWTVDEAWTSTTRVEDPLVGEIPVNRDSGRHGGCRLRFEPDGQLLIGTGDNAIGTNPQDLDTLAGKLLRVDPQTGEPAIAGFGLRNVQGIARRTDGTMWTVEHGTGKDDEINRGVVGNFGWDPIPDYNEGRPMTDLDKFPNAVQAAWSSGTP